MKDCVPVWLMLMDLVRFRGSWFLLTSNNYIIFTMLAALEHQREIVRCDYLLPQARDIAQRLFFYY